MIRRNKVTIQREEYLSSKGLNPDDANLWRDKWQSLIHNTKRKSYCCLLTFEQYVSLALETGITNPNSIGRTSDSFQMGRFGDVGNYELGNCRFINMLQNQKERDLNGGTETGTIKKRGRNADNYEPIAQMAAKLKGRHKKDYQYLDDISKSKSKSFLLVHINGEIHTGHNVKEFCELRGLDPSNMTAMLRGRKPQYRGWTGKYVD